MRLMELFWMDVRRLEMEAAWQRAWHFVSDARREKLLQLHNPQAARLSLGAGVLCSLAFAEGGISPEIGIGAHGKPYCKNSEFQFSLSHSGNAALCAFGRQPLGADLQQIKPELPRHTARILSPEESVYLDGLPAEERAPAFYRLWARKESLMKWDGRGIRLDMRQLSFVQAGVLRNEMVFAGKRLFLREYTDFLPEYAVSVCAESADFSPCIKKILII